MGIYEPPEDFIKPAQTMHGDFTYTNSPVAVARFPFPWREDSFRYSVNMEPHPGGPAGSVFEHAIDIDEHYLTDITERARCLADQHERYVSLPHTGLLQWDCLELLMESLARDYPQYFSLTKDSDRWTWENKPMAIKDSFTFGDFNAFECEPAEYIFRQVQGDMVALDQRDNNLWADLGLTTSAADWSMRFDAGMSFTEWHGPVPLAHEMGVFDRALQFLMNLRLGEPTRRLNWTLTVNPRQDTAAETYHEWGCERDTVTSANAGEKVHLRVELQGLFRLPRSNGILFSIRAYLCSFADLAGYNPEWAKRAHRVLRDLEKPIVDYKGITNYHDEIVGWLSQFDDGS